MNDTLEKTASSLVVVEKKTQRPGGCVGIFFQLFDWNRRFAKKKLFSKKLLPPVRLKQASKKFGGDDKQAKLRLIADENSGGFPTSKKNNNGITNTDTEQHQEMRVPSLVARLMGLESMPASHRDKSKKVPSSRFTRIKSDKFVDSVPRDESNVEKGGGTKHELRPQKLQKTSVFEKQPITRFGADKLPFKSVLSKSKKHHHPKLPSPVKSPRSVLRKSSSKLISAATRILEPGLQTSRSKCALTYPNTLHNPSLNGVVNERENLLSSNLGDYDDGFGHSSCRNCGYLPNNLDPKRGVSEKPLVFASSCQDSERIKPGNSVFYQEKLHELQSRVQFTSYKSTFDGRIERHSRDVMPLSLGPNHKTQSRIQILQPRAKTNNLSGAKNFVSVNQCLSGGTRSRFPVRIENGKYEFEKRIANSMNDSVPPGRKRRPANISKQGESAGFMSSTINKRSLSSSHGLSEKHMGYNRHLNNRQCSKNDNVASFTFNSQEVAERRNRNDLRCDDVLQKMGLRENAIFEKPSFPLSGDALGVLLQQKLKELNCDGEDMETNVCRKNTSLILQELICALTTEKSFQQDNLPVLSDRRNSWFNYSKLSNSTSSTSSQANAMASKLSVEQPLDSERPSPGSVLEAYFSTESCHSSTLDDSQGCKMLNESMDCSYYGPRSSNPCTELLDSAALMNNRAKNCKESVIDILNHVSEILCCNKLNHCGLKGNKLDQAKAVLLNAELVLHNTSLSCSLVGKGCPIKHLLLDQLETLASVLWMNFGSSIGIEDGKETNQLKTFVLDSIIEFLDVRYEGYPQVGSQVSRKLPIRVTSKTLMLEIVEALRRWDELSRYNLDELIEMEMSFSLNEWTDCETEAFESGMEISRNLIQILVDEIVMDIWNC